jgi:hypothetical protein
VENKELILRTSNELFAGVEQLIFSARKKVAISLNKETTLLYFNIGYYINTNLKENNQLPYGAKILATLSQLLTNSFGKGYSYSALTRMCKVANAFELSIVATLSQQLSWSHLIELSVIENETERNFYRQLCIHGKWGIRELREKIDSMLFERTAIATKPEATIDAALSQLEDGNSLNPDLVFKNSYILDFFKSAY